MTPEDMFQLAQDVESTLTRPEITAAVITHGTDTVEETAFLLNLVKTSAKPVVFVVAMRNLSELGTDGPRNLSDAIRTAIDPAAAGRGVLLVANQTIHSARFVTKTDTVNPQAFTSPDFGPAGIIDGFAIRFMQPAAPWHTVPLMRLERQVEIVKAVSGSDGAQVEWLVSRGIRGIVLEGSGAGNAPATMLPSIVNALAQGVTIVLTSRALSGFLSPTYGGISGAGGGFDLISAGVIPAQHLPSQKARIKLMLALGAGIENHALREFFAFP
jgi:L-asparaginase